MGTRITTGAGRRCTMTENTSYSTHGCATVSPTSRPVAAAAATTRSVRAASTTALDHERLQAEVASDVGSAGLGLVSAAPD